VRRLRDAPLRVRGGVGWALSGGGGRRCRGLAAAQRAAGGGPRGSRQSLAGAAQACGRLTGAPAPSQERDQVQLGLRLAGLLRQPAGE
jgi:hypothetical protein